LDCVELFIIKINFNTFNDRKSSFKQSEIKTLTIATNSGTGELIVQKPRKDREH
jgi:hypothetical protein